jgi:hypothetical protein
MIWTAAALEKDKPPPEYIHFLTLSALSFNRGGHTPVLFWTPLVLDRRYNTARPRSPLITSDGSIYRPASNDFHG